MNASPLISNKSTLAIYSLNVGLPSETFIKRHIDLIAPNKTVLLAEHIHNPTEVGWSVDVPLYRLRSNSEMGEKLPGWLRTQVPWKLLNRNDRRGVERFLTARCVTVILGQYLHDSWKLLSIAKRLGIKLFAHAHGYDLSRIYRDELWRQRYRDYAGAGGVIVVNQTMRRRMLGLGIPDKKIHIVPYGVDVPATSIERSVSKRIDLLAVGRMVGKKAPLSLLKAVQVARQGGAEVRLHYIGDGPLFSAVSEFVRIEGMQELVTLYGAQPHQVVLNFMAKCDVFVQHSVTDPESGDEEGTPVAILEAMAHSLPVVSTRHAGIPEAVIEGETGLLGEEGDIEAMAKSIILLYETPELRRQFGRSGWQRVRDEFSSQIEIESLRKIMALMSD